MSTKNQARIRYRNHRGEVAWRRIGLEPNAAHFHVWFGSTEWHPQHQWFLRAFDLDKDALRDFAMADVLEWKC